MNRRTYRKLLVAMESLAQHHLVVKENIDVPKKGEACRTLAECQSIAVEIGTAIEKSEGTGTKTIQYLEEYCEIVYELHESITNDSDAVLSYEHMQTTYEKALKSIREDLNVKLHVVFLPYKRAMWDSMESVWQAAKADVDCIAEVMPIPYFEKNTDGSLGEKHCEADLYDFPVLDYEQYDLAELQADVLVVHNPYDQYNHVTTVHPYFYMKNLKQWTDKLVYIPYFVHKENFIISKYAILPGTIYADMVVLQSEEIRQKYIDCFREETGIKEGLEKKFVALGSPKFDWSNKEDVDVPIEWETFLYKNGQRRKVIFFNTHVNYILKANSEAFLRKLRRVFDVFRNREDVVLLWRPHPLLLPTAKSLNPEAMAPYLELIDYYKAEKIGIYDESSDFRMALGIADAYYGCGTSIKEIFKKSGKPIMILDLKK